MEMLNEILSYFESSGIFTADIWKNILMIFFGLIFIYVGIVKKSEPLLLVPIGFGMILGNIPVEALNINAGPIGEEHGSFAYYIYHGGVVLDIFPPLVFLGIGALTDFSYLLSNARTLILGAAAQVGIFLTVLLALFFGFDITSSSAIGVIGGADGPTSIYTASKLSPNLLAPIAIAAYSYIALVPIIQPPIMKLLTTKEERRIRMSPPKEISKTVRIIFPIFGLLICSLLSPYSAILVGMIFLGNLLREAGVTKRLADTAGGPFIDIVTILLMSSVGMAARAETFLQLESLLIFGLGAIAFAIATASGILFAKLMNVFVKDKINPLIGAAGVSAVPAAARVAHDMANKEDPDNFILMHAMGPNVAGVIGSATAAGVLLQLLS